MTKQQKSSSARKRNASKVHSVPMSTNASVPPAKRPKKKHSDDGMVTDISDLSTTTCVRIQKGPIHSSSLSSKQLQRFGKSSSVLLQKLLHPLDLNTFLNCCFRECAVHIDGNHNNLGCDPETDQDATTNAFHSVLPILDDLSPASIIQNTSSENIFVWLQQSKSSAEPEKTQFNGNTESKLIHSIEVSDPDSAWHLYQAGHAVYCRAPPDIEQSLVRSFLADTGLGCGQYDPTGNRTTTLGRGEVEVFMSSTKGHVTGWHYDFQENFTLQVSGVKKWTVQKGTVKHPIRACTPHYNSPGTVESQLLAARLANRQFLYTSAPLSCATDTHTNSSTSSSSCSNAVGDVETITLNPGDVFYFPAGMWHKVEVIEPGISLNVSLMAATFAGITCQALEHVLLQREEWRQSVQHVDNNKNDNSPTSPSIDVIAQLESLLDSLPDIIRNLSQKCPLAKAILPPVLLCQPSTIASTKRNDNDDDESDDDDDSDDEETLIQVADFNPPPGSLSTMTAKNLEDWFKSHRLVQNPLAVLLEEESEIRSCYKTCADDEFVDDEGESRTVDEKKETDSIVYVLNVNYAGNESHESAIRVRLAMNQKEVVQIQNAARNEKNCNAAANRNGAVLESGNGVFLESDFTDSCNWILEHLQLVDCLVFYGYLVWQPDPTPKFLRSSDASDDS